MNKRYAIIEDGIVANIVAATGDPSSMTELLCIEADDTIRIGYIYDGEKFIENTIESEDINLEIQ
jgi:predicted acyltransferase (DUF342 family)